MSIRTEVKRLKEVEFAISICEQTIYNHENASQLSRDARWEYSMKLTALREERAELLGIVPTRFNGDEMAQADEECDDEQP